LVVGTHLVPSDILVNNVVTCTFLVDNCFIFSMYYLYL
jgi:hypothetical protein